LKLADSDAEDLIAEANLKHYVQFINARSDEVTIEGLVDLIFIDGDHSYEGCKADVFNYVPWYLRPGGYFILHDYYGWYDDQGRNNSPVKQVIDELIEEDLFEHLLVDTGYQSFTVFRNPA